MNASNENNLKRTSVCFSKNTKDKLKDLTFWLGEKASPLIAKLIHEAYGAEFNKRNKE